MKSPWVRIREIEKELAEERRRRQIAERENVEPADKLAACRGVVAFLKQEIEPAMRAVSQIDRTLAGQPWR